jgi:hypothetical protein
MIGGSRSILALSLLSIALAACSARAQTLDSNPSLGASASLMLVQDQVDASIGYKQGHGMPLQFGSSFRTLSVEPAYGYSILPSDGTRILSVDPDLRIQRGIANLYLSFTRLPLFTSYLGAGAAPAGDDIARVNGDTVETENDMPPGTCRSPRAVFRLTPIFSLSMIESNG